MRATEIVLHFDEREIEALQNALDCFSDESCTVEQKLREAFDSLYTELVPPEMQNAIEKEILKENIAQQEQTEADKRFGLFHGKTNNFSIITEFCLIEHLISVSIRLNFRRMYCL